MSSEDVLADVVDDEVTGKNEGGDDQDDWKDEDFVSFDDDAIGNKETLSFANAESGVDAEAAAEAVAADPHAQLPPWMEAPHAWNLHPLLALHNEILAFCHLVEPLEEEIAERTKIVARMEDLVHRTFPAAANDEAKKSKAFEVKVFGSQQTGLFLPTSDIDLVVLTNTTKEDQDQVDGGDININQPQDKDKESKSPEDEEEDWSRQESPLHLFATALREEMLPELSYLEILENTRIPLVKFTHAPTNINVDVSFDQPTGPKAAQLMHTFLGALAPLRPMTFVLKYFLAARGLNEPYSGGIGSYMLQLMIVSFLQHRERDAIHNGRPATYNLAALLLEFLELYGLDFNYITTGISVRHDGFYFPKGASDKRQVFYNPARPFMLAMENPLDVTADVGAPSFRISMIQRAFAVAYKQLLAYVAPPILPTVSILAQILPPSSYMYSRQAAVAVAREKRRQQTIVPNPSHANASGNTNSANNNYRGGRNNQHPNWQQEQRQQHHAPPGRRSDPRAERDRGGRQRNSSGGERNERTNNPPNNNNNNNKRRRESSDGSGGSSKRRRR